MALYDDYRNTDYLDDVTFIAGTEMVLTFPVYDSSNVALDISSCSMEWALGLYGQPEVLILQKTATKPDANTFQVALTKEDTIDLGDDIYLQQMRIAYTSGSFGTKYITPGQGLVIIRKAIPMV